MKFPWQKKSEYFEEDIDERDAFQNMALPGDKTRTFYAESDGEYKGRAGYDDSNDDSYADLEVDFETDLESEIDPESLLLDRYALLGDAGQGAFGSVVIGWDTRIERRVAIKCMPLEDTTGVLATHRGSILVDIVLSIPPRLPAWKKLVQQQNYLMPLLFQSMILR